MIHNHYTNIETNIAAINQDVDNDAKIEACEAPELKDNTLAVALQSATVTLNNTHSDDNVNVVKHGADRSRT